MPCSEKFEIVSHQYGSLSLKNHREMLDGGKGMTVLSIDLNQDEDEIIIEEELPGYTRFAFAMNRTVVSKLFQLSIFIGHWWYSWTGSWTFNSIDI